MLVDTPNLLQGTILCIPLTILCLRPITALPEMSPASNTGYFWQITDIHYDAKYSTEGWVKDMCHKSSTIPSPSLGPYGDYLCDVPWLQAENAVKAMKDIDQSPDFIVWTGDNFAHLLDDQFHLDDVTNAVGKITDLLLDNFPDTLILPSIGNHDVWPANTVPIMKNDDYYNLMLTKGKWNETKIEPLQQKVFKEGGYYLSQVTENIRVLALNTILWYAQNNLTQNMSDPIDHFIWLEEQLKWAKDNGQKVWLTGHVPLGVHLWKPYWPQYSKKLIELLQQYTDVVMAMIAGHEHRDLFRVIKHPTTNTPAIPIFLAPSITPLTSSLANGANNPGIRRFTYDKVTGEIMNIEQYYMNLTEANINLQPKWLLEYEFKDAYQVGDLSAQTLANIAESFKEQDQGWFPQYYSFYSTLYPSPECDVNCRIGQYCAIVSVDYEDNAKCVEDSASKGAFSDSFDEDEQDKNRIVDEPEEKREKAESSDNDDDDLPPGHHLHIALYVVVGFILVLIVGITLFCCIHRQKKIISTRLSHSASFDHRYALIT